MIAKKGIVTKRSGEETLNVEVYEYRTHPKYHKRYRVTRKFLVQDEKKQGNAGDEVLIVPCRPVSKKKSWKLEKILGHNSATQ